MRLADAKLLEISSSCQEGAVVSSVDLCLPQPARLSSEYIPYLGRNDTVHSESRRSEEAVATALV